MKKRILSLILAATMLVLSSTAAFAAQPLITAEPEDFYEGNKPFELAEKILDELNEDKEAGLFDDVEHDAQFTEIRLVNEAVASLDADDLSGAITHLTANLSEPQKLYLAAVVRADSDDEFKAEFDAIRPVEGLSLRESFGVLDNYITEVMEFLDGKVSIVDYDEIASKPYIAEPLIAILKVMFAQDGTADSHDDSGKYMRENYYDGFLTNDRVKKTLAVLFGADLTEEIVSDSVTSEKGIVRHVKNYISGNDDAIRDIKADLGNVMVADKEDAVDAAFDLLGKVVSDAYEGEDVQDDVIMLMGNGTDAGLVEHMIRAVDEDFNASNIWLNLFLSEFVQVYNVNRLDDRSITHSVEITDNSSISFKVEGLDDYGIGSGQANLPLNTGWFDVVCYVERETSGTFEETGYVTYSDGNIQITKDNTKEDKYDAFLVLYRKEADGVSTFIESYPVKIVNRSIPTNNGGGGTTRYTLSYETNGGTSIPSNSYASGATVQLTTVPVREGYIFAGWYSDEALTQKVESVVMNGNITIYAAWTKDGSSVVSKVDVPDKLNGDEHFAYVIGYPEGDVRPQNNITRAEAVTILFRLLKDDVRNANVTDVNVFTDVNEGDWYNKAVSTLAALEIVNGRTETEFMPNEYITRAEFATIFARFSEFSYTVDDEFKDIAGHWAEEYINEAAAYGWIAGYEDNTFRPDNRITRAEAMTLINRVLKRNPENTNDLLEGMSVWTDNADTSAWYYIAVQEATNSHEYIKKNDSYEAWTKLTENRDWTTFEN